VFICDESKGGQREQKKEKKKNRPRGLLKAFPMVLVRGELRKRGESCGD
jgi:hypothetical protein